MPFCLATLLSAFPPSALLPFRLMHFSLIYPTVVAPHLFPPRLDQKPALTPATIKAMCDNSPLATILIALDVDMTCHANTVDHQLLDFSKTWIKLTAEAGASGIQCSLVVLLDAHNDRTDTSAVQDGGRRSRARSRERCVRRCRLFW